MKDLTKRVFAGIICIILGKTPLFSIGHEYANIHTVCHFYLQHFSNKVNAPVRYPSGFHSYETHTVDTTLKGTGNGFG